MKPKPSFFFFTAFLFIVGWNCQSEPGYQSLALQGDYIGQVTPDSTIKLFAPGFISTNLAERDAAFSPDGKEFYFTLMTGRVGMIAFSKEENGQWQSPRTAHFSGEYSDLEPFLTTDGKRLYFVSNRPIEAGGQAKDYDIWFVERVENQWGIPQNAGTPVNSDANEFYPTLAQNGNLYFTARYEKGHGGEDLYVAKWNGETFAAIENLGNSINSAKDEFNSFAGQNEDFIVFSSFGREDGSGGGDLYISFKSIDGSWGKARNMGEPFNSTSLDYCPSLSPDGKFFFFTSRRSSIPPGTETRRLYENILSLLNQPGNGNDDIYWINSKVVWKLRGD